MVAASSSSSSYSSSSYSSSSITAGPPLLISAAALLIDALLKRQYAPTSLRLQLVATLWLTASLQGNNDTVVMPAALQAVFGLVTASIAIAASSIPSIPIPSSSISSRSCSSRWIASWLDWAVASASVAVWMAAGVEAVLLSLYSNHQQQQLQQQQRTTTTNVSIVTGCVAWILLLANRQRRWWRSQQRMQQRHAYAQACSNSNSSNSLSYATAVAASASAAACLAVPDERVWYTWDEAQVRQWLLARDSSSSDRAEPNHRYYSSAAVFATGNANANASMDVNAVWWTCLAAQGLCGAHLDQLAHVSVADLKQHVSMPYGPAAALLTSLRTLTQRHPRPATEFNGTAAGTANSSWLEQHDMEYNTRYARQRERERFHYAAAAVDASSPTDAPVTEQALPSNNVAAQQERAQSLMRDRYGLELPELRQPGTTASNEQPTTSSSSSWSVNATESPPLPPVVATAPPNQDLQHLTGLPPEFLANMPPHLKDIIRQKPDLAQQVMESSQRKAAASAAASSSSSDAQPLLQAVSEPITESNRSRLFGGPMERPRLGVVHEDPNDALSSSGSNYNYNNYNQLSSDDDEWQDNEGERTKLLRNRKPSASLPQYKSIE